MTAVSPPAIDERRVARGSVLNLIGMAFGAAANFAMLTIVGRAYGADAFGVFSGVTALFLLLSVVVRLGADTGSTWFVARWTDDDGGLSVWGVVRIATTPVVVCATVVALAVMALADPLASLLTDEAARSDFAAMLRIVAIMLPVAAVGEILMGVSRGLGSMRPTVMASQFGRQGGQLVAVAAVASLTDDLSVLAVAWAAPYVITIVYPAAWIAGVVGLRSGGESVPWRPFWNYAGPQAATAAAQSGLEKFDIIALGSLATVVDQGAYNAANRLAHVAVLGWYSVNLAHAPVYANLFERQRNREVGDLVGVASAWATLVVGPLLWAFALFAGAWLSVFGEDFGVGSDALVLLSAALLGALLLGPSENLLLMSGRSRQAFWNNVVALEANIALNLVLIPRWGATGAAVAWAVSLVFVRSTAAVQVYADRRVVAWSRPLVEAWVLVAVSSIGAALVARTLVGGGATGLVVMLALTGAGVLAGAWGRRRVLGIDELIASLRS